MYLIDVCPHLKTLARVELCQALSPLIYLPHLSKSLHTQENADARIFIKDNSMINSLYGGNKARKLEWILGDVLMRGDQAVCTTGGLGSHHALATALHSKELGLKCHLFLVSQPLTHHAFNTLEQLIQTGADITLAQSPVLGERISQSFKRQKTLWKQNLNAYEISAGGSSLLGTLGHVEAGLELAHQLRINLMPKPDVIYVAAGSCSTLAGITLALRIEGISTEVIGVATAPRQLVSQQTVIRLINTCQHYLIHHGARFELDLNAHEWGVKVIRGHLGSGYGYPSATGRLAADLAKLDHLYLDPIYTAKTMGALLEAERGKGRTSLFWHTLSASFDHHQQAHILNKQLNTRITKVAQIFNLDPQGLLDTFISEDQV